MSRTTEQHRIYMRAWRQTPKAKVWAREYDRTLHVRTYRRNYRQGERYKATAKKYKERYRQNPENRAREQEYRRKWYARHFHPTPPLPEFYPFLTGDERGCDLLMAVHSLTPSLPENLRQEVCQDAIVTVLSGSCSLAELSDRMNEIIRIAKRRLNGDWAISLDQPLAGTNRRLRDVI